MAASNLKVRCTAIGATLGTQQSAALEQVRLALAASSGPETHPCARWWLLADCLAVRDLHVQALEAFYTPIRAQL